MKKEILWIDDLDKIKLLATKGKELELKQITDILSGRGIFLLFILLNLPFCLPLQIPGISTPFGILLALLSLRLLFRRHIMYPKWLLRKKIKSKYLIKIVSSLEKIFVLLKKITRKRISFLTQNSWIIRFHALFFLFCSLFLAIPFPIPFTNLIAALPVLCISIGFLEEDGFFVLFGYLFISSAIFFLIHTLVRHG